jgi:hypothetical protein
LYSSGLVPFLTIFLFDNSAYKFTADDFTVIDINGIHSIKLLFCDCISLAPHRKQLLAVSWFPATVDRPQTAFTFNILNSFHLLTLQGKTSAFNYYHSLSHKSDNTGLLNVKVS